MKKLFVVFILIAIAVSSITTQETDPDMRLALIRSKAESGDELLKLEALKWIDRMIIDGSIDPEDEELMNIIINLGLEPFISPQRSGISPNLVNDHPLVRREAAVTLGRIGGPLAIDGLIEMAHFEEDLDVLKNIMYAFGNIAANPGDSVTEAIGNRIYRVNATNSIDNELAYATLYAIEQISISPDGIKDPSVYNTIIILSNDRFSNVVKNKALNVLELLWDDEEQDRQRGIQTTPVIPDDPEDSSADDSTI